MQTREQQPNVDPLFDRLLDEATVALIQARAAYAAVESDDGANEQAVATAWLRLWRAQERHRQLSATFEWAS